MIGKERSQQNLELMLEEIRNKLQVVNGAILEAERFDLEQYDDIRDIYLMIKDKNQFSVSEMDAIVSELGQLRKQ